jgi:hypothetical protein
MKAVPSNVGDATLMDIWGGAAHRTERQRWAQKDKKDAGGHDRVPHGSPL